MAKKSRGGFPALLQALLGVVLLLAGWTAMNFRGGAEEDADSSDRESAVATVGECREQGPISISGVGYWWSCAVEIDPEGGDSYEQTFTGSQFEPDETGDEVPMVSAGRNSDNWTRADVEANNWATIATAAGLLLGLVTFGLAVRRLLGRG